MKRKITRANEAAKVRLRAIEKYQTGKVTLRDVAEEFGVHITTVSEWIRMYETGGVERLNAPMKPRPVHNLDTGQLAAELAADPGNETLASLLDLSNGAGLNDTAAKYGISPQALAKRRRVYLKSKGE